MAEYSDGRGMQVLDGFVESMSGEIIPVFFVRILGDGFTVLRTCDHLPGNKANYALTGIKFKTREGLLGEISRFKA